MDCTLQNLTSVLHFVDVLCQRFYPFDVFSKQMFQALQIRINTFLFLKQRFVFTMITLLYLPALIYRLESNGLSLAIQI